MAAFKKLFKDLKNEHVLGIVGLVLLIFAFCKYSSDKNIFQVGFGSNNSTPLKPSPINSSSPVKQVNKAVPSSSSHATSYAPYNGNISNQAVSNSATSSTSMNKPATNPMDLLPKNSENSLWNTMNPAANVDNPNLLDPAKIVGINTQGSSLRNANLQLRSEPPNPRTNTNCPWNISTIESDKFRKSLEIGTQR